MCPSRIYTSTRWADQRIWSDYPIKCQSIHTKTWRNERRKKTREMCIEQQQQRNMPLCVKFNRIAGHILVKKRKKMLDDQLGMTRQYNLLLKKQQYKIQFNSKPKSHSTNQIPRISDPVSICVLPFPLSNFETLNYRKCKRFFLFLKIHNGHSLEVFFFTCRL